MIRFLIDPAFIPAAWIRGAKVRMADNNELMSRIAGNRKWMCGGLGSKGSSFYSIVYSIIKDNRDSETVPYLSDDRQRMSDGREGEYKRSVDDHDDPSTIWADGRIVRMPIAWKVITSRSHAKS